VNMASRLEGLTKAYGAKILISQAVYERVRDLNVAIRSLGDVQVVGATNSLAIYEVFQNDPLELKQFKLRSKQRFENALAISSKDALSALTAYRELEKEALLCSVEDLGLSAKIHKANSGASGADRYGKHGSELNSADVKRQSH